jgi:hypothetical protein
MTTGRAVLHAVGADRGPSLRLGLVADTVDQHDVAGGDEACATILLAVDVPFVTKYVRPTPNVSAASCCA